MLQELRLISDYVPTDGGQLLLSELVGQGIDREGIKTHFAQIGKSNSCYRQTYGRYKNGLISKINSNSIGEVSPYLANKYEIHSNYIKALQLIESDYKKVGVQIAKDTLTRAAKHGLVNIAHDLCRKLVAFYSVINADTEKRNYYKSKLLVLKAEVSNLEKVQDVFNDLVFCLHKQRSVDYLQEDIEELRLMKSENWQFHYWLFQIASYYFEIKGEPEKVIKTCKEAIFYFANTKTPLPYTSKFLFYRKIIPNLIIQGNYKLASTNIRRCIVLPKRASLNWHNVAFLKVVNYLHSKDYQSAVKAFKMAEAAKYRGERKDIGERLSVLRCYLQILHLRRLIEVSFVFKFRKNLNSIPSINRDKETANVSAIVAELVLLLLYNKKEEYLAVCDKLDHYIRKNLQKQKRERLFLKMLSKLPYGNWNAINVKRKASIYIKQFEKTSANSVESEIIPFDVLWKIVLDCL